MKNKLLIVIGLICYCSSSAQIQEYFVNYSRVKQYNSNLNAWGSWSEWSKFNVDSSWSLNHTSELSISNSALSINVTDHFGTGYFVATDYLITPLENTNKIKDGYKLYVAVKIKYKYESTLKSFTERSSEYTGILYSFDASWDDLLNTRVEKPKIIVSTNFNQIEYELNLISIEGMEEKKIEEKKKQDKTIDKGIKLFEALLKKK